MRIMGIDPGLARSAVAIIEANSEGYQILYSKNHDNEELINQLEGLIESYQVNEMAIEATFAYKNRQLRKTAKLAKKLKDHFKDKLPITYKPACNFGQIYTRDDMGWRQAFTGLRRPNEQDVAVELRRLAAEGTLKGTLPSNQHIVDAVGIAIYGHR